MCGIAGIFVDDIPLNVPSFKGVLEHRGPDSFGEFLDGTNGIWLYHNRLAIIDTSDGSSTILVVLWTVRFGFQRRDI